MGFRKCFGPKHCCCSRTVQASCKVKVTEVSSVFTSYGVCIRYNAPDLPRRSFGRPFAVNLIGAAYNSLFIGRQACPDKRG
ncbi:hypothetical protein WJX77_006175 [Trebouxia sp. C0004]